MGNGFQWENYITSFDDRRDTVIPGDKTATIKFCIEHFLRVAEDSINRQGYFAVALSGGSTPKAIYQGLSQEKYRNKIDWEKVMLFWSDERSVPKNHPDSNYLMAMDAGFGKLPILKEHIFPMKGENDIEENALEYEQLVKNMLPNGVFDLVMLGMGDDGHTASLFPKTHGLHSPDRLVIANYVPQLNTWRMTLTFDCINRARFIAIYVLGKSKSEMLKKVFSEPYDPDTYPIQKIGTPETKALWIADSDALKDVYLT